MENKEITNIKVVILNYKNAVEISTFNINSFSEFILTDYLVISHVIYLVVESCFSLDTKVLEIYVIKDELIANKFYSDLVLNKRTLISKLI